MAALSPVCGTIDALAFFQQKIIDAINGKFAALHRLAELLEQLGDATGFLPDISKLIPVSAINIALYENLRSSCKFLNLPPSQGSPAEVIGKLQAQVNAAYAALLAQLNLHPFSRLDKLQSKLDDYQQKFNIASLTGVDFMSCLRAACQAALAVESTVSSLSNTSSSHVIQSAQTFLKNTVTNENKILSSQAQAKVNTISSIKSQVNDLRNVPAIQLPVLPKK